MSDFEKKVIELLETINRKLDQLLGGGGVSSVKSSVETSKPSDSYVKPSAIMEKQQEDERMKDKPSVEGRRVCPDCGSTTFNTVEDKTQILHQQGGLKIYAKKYICKQCGKEVH